VLVLPYGEAVVKGLCVECGETVYASRYQRIDIGLSEVCNLSCNMCRRPQEREFMDIAQVLRLLFDAKRIGVRTVSFSGGEPFVHPHIRRILPEAISLGFEVELVTNGTLLQESDVRVLGQMKCVTISIDGPSSIHDMIRGMDGAWMKSMASLRLLARSSTQWGTNTVIQSINAEHLYDTWRCIRAAGRPSYVGFTHVEVVPETSHLQPAAGQTSGIKEQLSLIRSECKNENIHFNDDQIVTRLYDIFADKTRRYRPADGCSIPQTFLGVSSYGIFPCWHQGRSIHASNLIEALESDLCRDIVREGLERRCVGCNAANYSWSEPWVSGIERAALADDWIEGVVYLSTRERMQGHLAEGKRTLPILERDAKDAT
jgi:MoaA/NifB/PqqE/SkfB family radical SAM enzyme